MNTPSLPLQASRWHEEDSADPVVWVRGFLNPTTVRAAARREWPELALLQPISRRVTRRPCATKTRIFKTAFKKGHDPFVTSRVKSLEENVSVAVG
jgi:hypothetical protein